MAQLCPQGEGGTPYQVALSDSISCQSSSIIISGRGLSAESAQFVYASHTLSSATNII